MSSLQPLEDAAEKSRRGRLRHFIGDHTSEPVKLFDRTTRSSPGDWYGEHAGKWLVTASMAAVRAQDGELEERVRRVADWLCDQQEANGYLGTYAKFNPARFDSGFAAEGERTWDLWNAACTMLGLTTAAAHCGCEHWEQSASGIAELIAKRCRDGLLEVSQTGNHMGLSSSVVIEPLCRLAVKSGSKNLVSLVSTLISQLEDCERVRLVSAPLEGLDASQIGTGKIYQLCWVFHGVALASETLSDSRLLVSAEAFWANVADHHLTPLGGPWGGIATHKEVFNPRGYFNPCGMVETCSTLAWIRLSIELYRLTGKDCYAEAVEVAALNQLLGAAFPNGEDWSYFSMPNGPRSVAYDWACCKSSGAWALEEALAFLYQGHPAPATGESRVTVLTAQERIMHHEHEVLSRDYFALQKGAAVYAMEPLDGFQFDATLRLPVLFPGAYIHEDGEKLVITAPGHEPIWFAPYRDAGLNRPDRWRITWVPVVWQ